MLDLISLEMQTACKLATTEDGCLFWHASYKLEV